MDKETINDRMNQLGQEIERHQHDLAIAQKTIQQLSQLIVSKRGGLTELDKLLYPNKYANPAKKLGDHPPNTPDGDGATTVETNIAPSDPNVNPCPVATPKKAKKNKGGNKKKKKAK